MNPQHTPFYVMAIFVLAFVFSCVADVARWP